MTLMLLTIRKWLRDKSMCGSGRINFWRRCRGGCANTDLYFVFLLKYLSLYVYYIYRIIFHFINNIKYKKILWLKSICALICTWLSIFLILIFLGLNVIKHHVYTKKGFTVLSIILERDRLGLSKFHVLKISFRFHF